MANAMTIFIIKVKVKVNVKVTCVHGLMVSDFRDSYLSMELTDLQTKDRQRH